MSEDDRDARIRARLAAISPMTPEERASQRESFARGQVAIDKALPAECDDAPFGRCSCGESLFHQDEHPDECCDCFDLGFGCPLEKINEERAARGVRPLLARHVVAVSESDHE